ncbi:hypothetical protein PWT90_10736 [Aphanocladium album]|nr:hypothetical protein PWT90_10736 [Aphanocladium album]
MQDKYPDGAPEDPERMAEWRADMYKALYRSLLAGAALAGVYQEPWHYTKQGDVADGILECSSCERTTEVENNFIFKHTVLQTITALQQDASIFCFLDQWLLGDILADTESRDAMAHRFQHKYGRAEACIQEECELSLDGGSHADAHLITWELFKMYWTAEQLTY